MPIASQNCFASDQFMLVAGRSSAPSWLGTKRRYSRFETSRLPIQKPLTRTRCAGFSSGNASLSPSSEPIVNSPAGTQTRSMGSLIARTTAPAPTAMVTAAATAGAT